MKTAESPGGLSESRGLNETTSSVLHLWHFLHYVLKDGALVCIEDPIKDYLANVLGQQISAIGNSGLVRLNILPAIRYPDSNRTQAPNPGKLYMNEGRLIFEDRVMGKSTPVMLNRESARGWFVAEDIYIPSFLVEPIKQADRTSSGGIAPELPPNPLSPILRNHLEMMDVDRPTKERDLIKCLDLAVRQMRGTDPSFLECIKLQMLASRLIVQHVYGTNLILKDSKDWIVDILRHQEAQNGRLMVREVRDAGITWDYNVVLDKCNNENVIIKMKDLAIQMRQLNAKQRIRDQFALKDEAISFFDTIARFLPMNLQVNLEVDTNKPPFKILNRKSVILTNPNDVVIHRTRLTLNGDRLAD